MTLKTLTQSMREYVAGCFTGIWIQTQEPQEAISEIKQLCQSEGWGVGTWNIDRGLHVAGQAVPDLSLIHI